MSLLLAPSTPSPLETFPAPPPGFWRLGWQGISLSLPDSWNLCFHKGTAQQGTLIFADLRQPRLEIRWKTPPKRTFFCAKSPAAILERTLAKLRPAHSTTRLAPAAWRIFHNHQTILLAADAHRCYELIWPGTPDHFDPIATDFLANTLQSAIAGEWLWNIFGITSFIPARSRLQEAHLFPGESRLTFSHCPTRHHTITLASHSLADRLLRGQSLHDWATNSVPIIKQHPAGRWTQSDDHLVYEHQSTKRWPRFPALLHRVDLFHDHAGNRIRWSHHCSPLRSANKE